MKSAQEIKMAWSSLVIDGFFATPTYEAERRYKKAASRLDVPKEATVLEIGCGSGRYHRLLKQLGFTRLVSCDLTLEHIQAARAINPAGWFVVASGQALPFRTGIFDAITSNAAIEHFSAPADGLREFARVVRPGGLGVITSDCYSWRILQILGLYRSKMPVDRAISFWRMKRIFHSLNLDLTDYDAWGITHYLRRLARIGLVSQKNLARCAEDTHWSNRYVQSGLLRIIRTLILDEDLFVVRKDGGDGAIKTTQPSRHLDELLACPGCHSDIERIANEYRCVDCHTAYPIADGIPILLPQN